MHKVFISYSHDSPEHRAKVNAFSERLRQDGIETILDQHVKGTPPGGWPRWMTDVMEAADYVIVVCTETYYRRFRGKEEPGRGKGVDWEGALITQEIYDSRSTTPKFVPVFLSEAIPDHIPEPLRLHTHYALISEEAYGDLLDFLLDQAGVQPGAVGTPRLKIRPTAEPLRFGASPTAVTALKPSNLPSGYLGRIFLGRDEFLKTLRQSLLGASHATAITQKSAATGISGLGGIGKTHAAIAYAEAYRDDYAALLFASADTPAKLHASLAGLCDVLHLNKDGNLPPDEPTRLRAALSWISSNPGWLLIIDNVDDEPSALALRELLGHLSLGHVLITSRIHGWSDQVKNLDLDVLEKKDASNLLLQLTEDRRRKADGDVEQALQLVRLLEGLPLAIHQAAGFINERTLTLATYYTHYQRESETLLEWFNDLSIPYERPDKLAPRPVLVTWRTSFEQLTEDERFWLLVFSHYSPDPIPEFLLEPTDRLKPEQIAILGKANSAIARAEKFCLLTRSRTEPVFKIHRLVQEITRTQAGDEMRIWAISPAIGLIQWAEPGDPLDVRSWTKWDLLQPHAASICHLAPTETPPEKLTALLAQLGGLYLTKGLYSQAEPMMREASRVAFSAFGNEHPETALSFNNLASLLQETNRLAEAEPLMREALRIDRAIFGKDHPSVARDLNNLAGLLFSSNRLEESEVLMRESLQILRTVYGEEHHTVASLLDNLAGVLKSTGRAEEAETLSQEALRISRTIFGEDHPKTAIRLNNLAHLLQMAGRLIEAEPLMRTALSIDRAALGNDHPKITIRLNNLATLLKATERLAEAEPLLFEALSISLASLGPEHPNTLTIAENLMSIIDPSVESADGGSDGTSSS